MTKVLLGGGGAYLGVFQILLCEVGVFGPRATGKGSCGTAWTVLLGHTWARGKLDT